MNEVVLRPYYTAKLATVWFFRVYPNASNKDYASNNLSYPDKSCFGCKIVAINPRSVSTGNNFWRGGEVIRPRFEVFVPIQIM
jgi:hypothetical protein